MCDMPKYIDTLIIGGGQAGLSLSYHLSQLGREHVLLERARLVERWRSERWDSLAFQFPNWAMTLPGFARRVGDADAFATREEVVQFLEDYATYIGVPLRTGVNVLSVSLKSGNVDRFGIETNEGHWEARNVVLATGPFQQPSIPQCGASVAARVTQLHSRQYRHPQQLPPGAVLVVGAGTSGAEIAHELSQTGREVYVSVGRYRKAPRRYRGQDIFWWIEALQFWDSVGPSPEGRLDGVPLLTGTKGGYDIDLRSFALEGVRLIGRLRDINDEKLTAAGDLEENLHGGEVWFRQFRQMIDDYAESNNLNLPGADELPPPPSPSNSPSEINLKDVGINSIIWATGYSYDFGWVHLPVFNEFGQPVQRRGVTGVPGLFFLGLRRMHKIKSALLSESGVGADAAHVARQILDRG
jgi:putative flavoprotein involved in K+ transport